MVDAPVSLRKGPLALTLVPGQGGACSALRWHPAGGTPVDLLRPTPAGAGVFEASCFPLVPYSNRLFEGRLLASAGECAVPRNHERVDHPVHGVGWRRAWRVTDQDRRRACLSYRHEADEHWPFDHVATQTVEVHADRVRFGIELRNEGDIPMPAGIGLHPRFVIDAGDHVRWDAVGTREACDIEMNDCFGDWPGRARIDRRSRGLRLRLRASARLGHLMVYRTKGQPWLCLEPVSHATGAFSLPRLHHRCHGAMELAPGRAMRGWMELHIESHAFPPTS